MTGVLRAAASPGEVRVAAWRDGMIHDAAIWRPGAPDGLNDVHVGRVLASVRALGGAFVAITGNEGFLPDRDGISPGQGDAVVVRVVRAAQGGKGPRLARLDEPATLPVRLLRPGPHALLRLAAAWPDAPVLIDDAALVPALAPVLGARLSLVPHAWDEAVAAQWAQLAESEIDLPGGARMSIWPTPALVAIDLDTAGASAARVGKAAAQMAANLAALPELARQIRARNLSGAILVDFAGLPARKRAALRPALEAALDDDPARPRLLGFTALGLGEILRPRAAPPLHEVLRGPHAAGLAALRELAEGVAADPSRLPTLRAAPAVIAALQQDQAALSAMAARAGRMPILRSDPILPGSTWILEPA